VGNAIAREKAIKGLLRRKKIALIESVNPTWEDLSENWYGEVGGLAEGACCRRRKGRSRAHALALRLTKVHFRA